MGTTVGANADELDDLAGDLRSTGNQLERTRTTITSAVASSPWEGTGAQRFRELWARDYARSLAEARTFLDDAGEALRRNATEQRDASRADAGGVGTDGGRSHTSWWDRIVDAIRDLLQRGRTDDLPLFHDGPQPSDTDQGGYGDCWLLAGLAAVAATPEGRKLIERMIKDNGDGTYTVTFGDGSTVTVRDVESSLNSMSHDDKWVLIMENAWKERYGEEMMIAGSSDPTEVFKALGLKDPGVSWLQGGESVSDAELRKVLMAPGPKVASAQLGPSDTYTGFDYPSSGGHRFSVLEATETTVTLRNPWGDMGQITQPPGVVFNDDGTFTMTYDQFRQYFYRVGHAAPP